MKKRQIQKRNWENTILFVSIVLLMTLTGVLYIDGKSSDMEDEDDAAE